MCVRFIHKSTDFNRIFRSEFVSLISFRHDFSYFLELFSNKCQQIEKIAFINFKWNVDKNVFIRQINLIFLSSSNLMNHN